jgi:hypothetical protein
MQLVNPFCSEGMHFYCVQIMKVCHAVNVFVLTPIMNGDAFLWKCFYSIVVMKIFSQHLNLKSFRFQLCLSEVK